MGFHITQPGSSVATSLIDGESNPKHVLLLEIKVSSVKYLICRLPIDSTLHFFFFLSLHATHIDALYYREINIVQPRYR